MMNYKRPKYINFNIVILITIIGLINSFFYSNFIVMFILAVIEIVWLFYCLIRGKDVNYILLYMVFLAFSLENASYVGTDVFYGFKNFRILGLNLGIWMIIPIFLKQMSSGKYKIQEMPIPLRKLLKGVFFITIFGLIIGLLTFASNDNGIGNISGSFRKFIDCAYIYIFVLIEVLTVASVFSKHIDKLVLAKQFLIGSIFAFAIVCVCCVLFKNYGNRGGLDSLQISNLYFLLVASTIVFAYDDFEKMERFAIFISGLIILICALIYNSNGKMIILSATIPILAIIILVKKKISVQNLMIGIIIISTVVIGSIVFLPRLLEQSFLFRTKFNQFASLFSFWEKGWFINMEKSPRMRMTEFMNIGNELLSKPWFLVLGKGFMGSIQDKLNLFGNLTEFDFSKWELDAKAYFVMHESVNSLFLSNGLFGLFFLFSNLYYMLRKLDKSPWIIFGFLWLLLFYTYSLTISIFGVVSLIVSYYDIASYESIK